jgi:hypothetical protein
VINLRECPSTRGALREARSRKCELRKGCASVGCVGWRVEVTRCEEGGLRSATMPMVWSGCKLDFTASN